jgi:hypothetical protein
MNRKRALFLATERKEEGRREEKERLSYENSIVLIGESSLHLLFYYRVVRGLHIFYGNIIHDTIDDTSF